MNHQVSTADREFQLAFEACNIVPAEFDHAAHVRLAYVYLCGQSVDAATAAMKKSLLAFLAHLGVGEAKYHETITRAWIMAVSHFMAESSTSCDSAATFVNRNPRLLDPKIMLSHYSADTLFSSSARQSFVPPDIQRIPEHV